MVWPSWLSLTVAASCVSLAALYVLHQQGVLSAAARRLWAPEPQRPRAVETRDDVDNDDEAEKEMRATATLGYRNRFECNVPLVAKDQEPRPQRVKHDAVGSRRVLQIVTMKADRPSLRDSTIVAGAQSRKLHLLATKSLAIWSFFVRHEINQRRRALNVLGGVLERTSHLSRLPKKKPPARPLPLDATDVHRAEIGIAPLCNEGASFEQWTRDNTWLVNLSDIPHDKATRDGHGGGARQPPAPKLALATLPEAEKIADLGTAYHNRLVAALGSSGLSLPTARKQHGEDDINNESADWPAGRDGLATHLQRRALDDSPSVGSGDGHLLPQALGELASLSTEEIIYREFRLAVDWELDQFQKYNCRRG